MSNVAILFREHATARAQARASRVAAEASLEATITAGDSLDGVFRERVRRTPDAVAYVQFEPATGIWRETTWGEAGRQVARWQTALRRLGLQPGERVALMLGNSREWVFFDQAALGLGLVTVPLYTADRADNVAWVLEDSGARALLIEGPAQGAILQRIAPVLRRLHAVISLQPLDAEHANAALPNLVLAGQWLSSPGGALAASSAGGDALATLVYTSGTTGKPKGVMLSHRNILFNVRAGLAAVAVNADDRLLSFLPLSHMLERTVGHYLPMVCGCSVAYARSIQQLSDDLLQVRPTILIAVPRMFERVHGRVRESLADASALRQRLFAAAVRLGWQRYQVRQGRARWSPTLHAQPLLDRLVGAKVRARLGGQLRFAISGGAPLAPEISRLFIGLGVEVLQGYGLTETSPVIAVNRRADNEPTSVGQALPGIEVAIGEHQELLTRSPSVMLGYWRDRPATRALIDNQGWLHTGDQAQIGPRGHIRITGRLKDILVLSTGEKIAPADVEQALAACPLVEQVMILGDGRPYLSALVVPSTELPAGVAAQERAEWLRKHLLPCLEGFPGYAKLARVAVVDEPWTLENGLLTPTLKLRRQAVMHRYQSQVESLYAGH